MAVSIINTFLHSHATGSPGGTPHPALPYPTLPSPIPCSLPLSPILCSLPLSPIPCILPRIPPPVPSSPPLSSPSLSYPSLLPLPSCPHSPTLRGRGSEGEAEQGGPCMGGVVRRGRWTCMFNFHSSKVFLNCLLISDSALWVRRSLRFLRNGFCAAIYGPAPTRMHARVLSIREMKALRANRATSPP